MEVLKLSYWDDSTYREFRAGYPIPDKFSNEFQEYCDEKWYTMWVELKETLRDKYNVPCIVSGELGLWDGKHTLQEVEFDSLLTALDKVVADEFSCNIEDNKLYIFAPHHDGVNNFVITLNSGEFKKEDFENWSNDDI